MRKKRRLAAGTSLMDLPEDLLFHLVTFANFWDSFYLFKTCNALYSFSKKSRTINYLTKRFFEETTPNKEGLFEWISTLLDLNHTNYLSVLLGREIIFSEFVADSCQYKPIITVGPFTKCKHVVILLCLIRSFKSTAISVNIRPPPPSKSNPDDQIKEYKRKQKFFSVLLAIIDHLDMKFIWSPIGNLDLMKIAIEGFLPYKKNIDKTIQEFLAS